jgi:putative chitinase
MTVLMTLEKLAKCIPTNSDVPEWYAVYTKVLPTYGIMGELREAHFIAQMGHESADFKFLVENLNYSAQGLLKTFPKYFTPSQAARYARKPQMIASRVYANRMGNGTEASGEGWQYRGRGIIQITGKYNYSEYAKYKGMSGPAEAVDYLMTKEGAMDSACWYWMTRNLNALADRDDLISITKKINGGLKGFDDRKIRYRRARAVL